MIKKRFIVILSVLLLLLSGCAETTIKEINSNPDSFYGKTVIVSGRVSSQLDMGPFSGFSLKSLEGPMILVSSSDVPAEKSNVTVKGVVTKGTYTPQYIEAIYVEKK